MNCEKPAVDRAATAIATSIPETHLKAFGIPLKKFRKIRRASLKERAEIESDSVVDRLIDGKRCFFDPKDRRQFPIVAPNSGKAGQNSANVRWVTFLA